MDRTKTPRHPVRDTRHPAPRHRASRDVEVYVRRARKEGAVIGDAPSNIELERERVTK